VKTEFIARSDDGRALHAIRTALSALLREIGTPDSEVFAAELVIGELLTNAYRYAPGDVFVSLDCDMANASLTVRDRGVGLRLPASLPDMQSERGRGLFIVQSLVEALESRQHEGWSEVRADLRIRRRALSCA